MLAFLPMVACWGYAKEGRRDGVGVGTRQYRGGWVKDEMRIRDGSGLAGYSLVV
jgi:hypothetical protein